jgi:Metal-sensitive transcriptional repressor
MDRQADERSRRHGQLHRQRKQGRSSGSAAPHRGADPRLAAQVASATKALQSFALQLLEEHLATCVVSAAGQGGEEADIKVKEAADAIGRLVRS